MTKRPSVEREEENLFHENEIIIIPTTAPADAVQACRSFKLFLSSRKEISLA